MNRSYVSRTAWEQLAKDYNCAGEDFTARQVLITRRAAVEGRRRYQAEPPSFQAVTNGIALVIMVDGPYYEWAKKEFAHQPPEWFFEMPNLLKIESALRRNGETLADAHEFYLPLCDVPRTTLREEISIHYYSQKEIFQFRGDERFRQAYAFQEDYPDILGISASSQDELLGMAGASRDSDTLYQIGIDVLPHAEGKGIGSYLTSLLKEKIMDSGKIPFYGTAVSHIASQNVARRAGFYPAWAELYSKKAEQSAF